MLAGGDTGPALTPGDPEGSLLVQAVRHADDSLKMPPTKPLPKARPGRPGRVGGGRCPWPKAAAAQPIEGQAHWAFEPLRALRRPADPDRLGVAADRPVHRRGAAGQGLHPVAKADRRALVRRAYFDLIGLPPEPDRVEAFVADERPDAFAKLVEELLASPALRGAAGDATGSTSPGMPTRPGITPTTRSARPTCTATT